MNRTTQILLAFVLGQVLQLILQALSSKLVSANPLVVCIIIGVLVTLAFCVGITLANREQEETNTAIKEVFGDEVKID